MHYLLSPELAANNTGQNRNHSVAHFMVTYVFGLRSSSVRDEKSQRQVSVGVGCIPPDSLARYLLCFCLLKNSCTLPELQQTQ